MAQLSLGEILERISIALLSELRATATKHDLKLVQLQTLHYLGRCNRYSDTPAALTEFLGITKGTASQTLIALERKGLVDKVTDTGDRRLVHCTLTPAGRAVFRKTHPLPFDQLGVDDRLQQRLIDLLAGAQRARGGRSFSVCSTCRYFETEARGFRCGLTSEPLKKSEIKKICREHVGPRRPGRGADRAPL